MLPDNLLNSSNFLFSTASYKAPGKRDALRKLASGGETAINSFSDCDRTGITDEISSHLVMLRCNLRPSPLRSIIVISSSTVNMCPPIVISSIKPTTSSLQSMCKRGYMVTQNNSGSRGSPCCVPSSEEIDLDPYLSLVDMTGCRTYKFQELFCKLPLA